MIICLFLVFKLFAHTKRKTMAIGDTGTWTDPRDGQIYPWKVMPDGVKWMTKNYNFKTSNSIYYNNDSTFAEYGRYYSWQEVTDNLPAGWHIPNPDEWSNLNFKFDYKTFDGLFKGVEDRNGNNSGFNAMKAGIWKKDGGFVGKGDFVQYLTSRLGSTYGNGDKCHTLCSMTNCMSFALSERDINYKATCRLIISGY